jgi:hypothetical protein
MIRSVAKLCLTSAFVMSLLACSSGSKKEPEENPNVFPSDYKNEILNTMTSSLDDPTNIRSAYISEPALRPAGKEQRYVVCVRSDSRDYARQYTGVKDRAAIFYGGHLNQLIDATKEQCGNAAYRPFPELEKLCQAKKCV